MKIRTKPSDLPSCDPSHVSTCSFWNCPSFPVFSSGTGGISHAWADARLPPWAHAPFLLPLVQILFVHVPLKLILPKVRKSEEDCGLKTTCRSPSEPTYLHRTFGPVCRLTSAGEKLLSYLLFHPRWTAAILIISASSSCTPPHPLFSSLTDSSDGFIPLKLSNDWRSNGPFPAVSPSWIIVRCSKCCPAVSKGGTFPHTFRFPLLSQQSVLRDK